MYNFFQSLSQGLFNGISAIANWFGGLLSNLFGGLKDFITSLFAPLILLFQGIWYLITSIFTVVVLVIQVILGLFYVAAGIIGGIFTTFSSLMGFTGSTSYYYLPSAYQQGFNSVTDVLNQSGFNTLAYIVAAFVWMMTAYALIKIVGGER